MQRTSHEGSRQLLVNSLRTTLSQLEIGGDNLCSQQLSFPGVPFLVRRFRSGEFHQLAACDPAIVFVTYAIRTQWFVRAILQSSDPELVDLRIESTSLKKPKFLHVGHKPRIR